jgi:hypothetical protein
MKNPDADMAVKSANSEAMKNAAKNGFGVALELWDADHRKNLEVARRAAGGSEQALKKAVFDLAKERLGKSRPTLVEVATLFGQDPEDMSDPQVLGAILEREGVV